MRIRRGFVEGGGRGVCLFLGVVSLVTVVCALEGVIFLVCK
jgi:hypothetical protein